MGQHVCVERGASAEVSGENVAGRGQRAWVSGLPDWDLGVTASDGENPPLPSYLLCPSAAPTSTWAATPVRKRVRPISSWGNRGMCPKSHGKSGGVQAQASEPRARAPNPTLLLAAISPRKPTDQTNKQTLHQSTNLRLLKHFQP